MEGVSASENPSGKPGASFFARPCATFVVKFIDKWLTMTTPTNAGDERLIRGSRALWYEVAMIRDLHDRLRSGVHEPRFLRNAQIESFLIHARQVYDFFYEKGRQDKGGFFAYQYFPTQEKWNELRDGVSKGLASKEDWRDRINEEVAHITGERAREPEVPQHEIDWIRSELDKIQRAFRDHAHPLHERWRKYENPVIGDGIPSNEGDKRTDHADGTGTSELP